MANADATWQRQRIIAAADYWIKQKLNYCHHYLPNYATLSEGKPNGNNLWGVRRVIQ